MSEIDTSLERAPIPVVLYHGTNMAYLIDQMNKEGDEYINPSRGEVCLSSNLYTAYSAAYHTAIQFHFEPVLLIIDTEAVISRGHTITPGYNNPTLNRSSEFRVPGLPNGTFRAYSLSGVRDSEVLFPDEYQDLINRLPTLDFREM
ncbi:MAG: hypothetical protein ACOCXQ_04160 [Patescibacteria group bacterium]